MDARHKHGVLMGQLKYIGSVEEDLIQRVSKVPGSNKELILAKPTLTYYGVPCWFVEEWRGPEKLVPEGSGLDPEADWESKRYVYGELEVDPTLFGDRRFIDPLQKRDVLGPFPKFGRYYHLATLRNDKGESQEPNEVWLAVIAECWARKHNRRFASIEAEMRDAADTINRGMQEREDARWKDFETRVKDNLRTHGGRILDPARANKGGSGASIVIHDSAKAFTGFKGANEGA